MDYYASYKNSKDPSLLRKELVGYALTYGNKKAAQHFQTTIKTVRKWRKRWQEQKGMGLKDRSKKPQKSPRMMKMYWQFKIKALAEITIQLDHDTEFTAPWNSLKKNTFY